MKRLFSKKKINRKLFFLASLFVWLGFAFVFFASLFPAQAAHAEAIYAVLKNTDPGSFGGKIQQIWKSTLDIINALLLALMILVGFAEMLRLKVDTYGIKKILPTLIFAIIAANFSFILCRIIIDISNVSLTFISCISGASGTGDCLAASTHPTLTKAALIDPPPFNWVKGASWAVNLFNNTLILNILIIVESVLLICLSFLFICRNWVLYALVIFSPLAIMAIVLPQTKTYFQKWWDSMIKWAFMPLISLTLVAFANRFFADVVKQGGPIMGLVFVGVCLYYAITMPFKLGGPIMESFYKNTGAKWAVDTSRKRAKEKWVDPLVQEAKDRALIWYRHQGSNNNPIGAMARHSERARLRQEGVKRWTETSQDQLGREAFGGKYGKGGARRGLATGDQFMSLKRQKKWAEFFDSIEADGGEWDWKKKDLKNKFLQSDKGKAAQARMLQYTWRVETTDNQLKATDLLVRNIANSFKGTKKEAKDNVYHKNAHYHNIHNALMESRASTAVLELTDKKFEGDFLREVEANAYVIDMHLQGYKESSKTIAELKKKIAAATGGEKIKLEQELVEQVEFQTRSKDGWEKLNAKFKEKYYDADGKTMKGRSQLLSKILLDKKGGYITDIEQATSLHSIVGLDGNADAIHLFDDRIGKRVSLISKDELSSVMNKRSMEGSIAEIRNNPEMKAAVLQILAGNYGGLAEDMLRKPTAETAAIMLGMGGAGSAKFKTGMRYITSLYADSAMSGYGGPENRDADVNREYLAGDLGYGLATFSNEKTIYDNAVKEAEALVASGMSQAEADSQAFLEQIEAQYHITGSESALLRQHVRVSRNPENGRIEVSAMEGVNEHNYEKHGQLMLDMIERMVSQNPRGTTGNAMTAIQSSMGQRIQPGKEESGKGTRRWLGQERGDED